MGCGNREHGTNCVCKVLREIADAQQNVTNSDCDVSCKKSIRDLLGDTEVRNNFDTVPVILYCKGNCKPFKGFGAHPDRVSRVFASFYFRVKKVDRNCCATLELLFDPSDVVSAGENRKRPNNPVDPVDQKTRNLRRTGICITVDLKCFCHVTCLPAVSTSN